MKDISAHPNEIHFVNRSGWLRAAVLGANDGIISISSLILGVAAANSDAGTILIAAVAGLSAGAMSMAAGEYVSVSSQSDIEKADIKREQLALNESPQVELEELAAIYRARGLSKETANKVAQELSDVDALDAHVRDELGLSDINSANPLQAALASGFTFSIAGVIPILAVIFSPASLVIPSVIITTILALMLLGVAGAFAGGAPWFKATLRVVSWGIFAMAATSLIGTIFGVSL